MSGNVQTTAIQTIPGTSRKRVRPAQLDQAPPDLPPEMLQAIFCNLEFFDPRVLRCGRVCTFWVDCILGDEPILRNKLFIYRQVPAGRNGEHGDEDDSEETAGTTARGKSEVDSDSDSDSDLTDPSEDEDDQDDQDNQDGEDQEDQEETEIPTLKINLRALVQVLSRPNEEPMLSYGLEIGFDYRKEGYSNNSIVLNFPSGKSFHPMLEKIETFMHLVDDNINVQDNGESHNVIALDTFRQLGKMTLQPMNGDEDGSWKDNLLSLPAARRVDVVFEYT